MNNREIEAVPYTAWQFLEKQHCLMQCQLGQAIQPSMSVQRGREKSSYLLFFLKNISYRDYTLFPTRQTVKSNAIAQPSH